MTKTAQEILVRQARWPEDKTLLRSIRGQVFIEEQKVPKELEWDNRDEDAKHYLAFDNDKNAIACARLLPNGQLGRMAVIKPWRNQGIGRMVLDFLISEVGTERLFCHAQAQAVSFYQQAGFVPVGERFMEAGIEHQSMEYRSK